MSALIICSSKSTHANTTRIAQAMAKAIDADVVTAQQATPEMIASADLVGFGSGIYWMNFHADLRTLIDGLANGAGTRAFIFATSGLPETPLRRYTRSLGRTLEANGFRVAGTFTCRGLDTMGPLAIGGGLNKGAPTADDLDSARRFAAGLTQ